MLEINFDFDTEGSAHEDAFLDAYELDMLFQQTSQSIRAGLERKLADVTCAEHGNAPRITITGRYDRETEQMDLNYHVDTCCQLFLVRVVKLLNNV
ncbi:MAG: hypothetical protein CL607_27940 [Anaerolineaceae bacterium]|nr:hypothetical protein [Anaerolineaceae bacterium]